MRAEGDDEAPGRRAGSLPAHLERVVARLTALQAGTGTAPALLATAAAVARELDASAFGARALRGDARAAFLEHLSGLDAQLLAAAREGLAGGELAELTRQAEQELRSFRDRMTVEAHAAAVAALVDRLVRERCQLPFVSTGVGQWHCRQERASRWRPNVPSPEAGCWRVTRARSCLSPARCRARRSGPGDASGPGHGVRRTCMW